MANPVLRGTVIFRDQASGVLNRIRAAQTSLNRSIVEGQSIGARGLRQMGQTSQALKNYNAGLKETAERTKSAGQHTRDMHITLTGMLKVMAMFAINLQIIRAATSPFTFLRSAITQAGDFQASMQEVNALLRISDVELRTLGLGVRRIASDFGIANTEVLQSVKEIASSVSALNLGPLSEQEATILLVREAARGAVIDNSSLIDSTNALKSVMAGLNLEITLSKEVMATLFATVDVGTVTFSQLGQNIGDFLGSLAGISPSDPQKRIEFLQQTLAIFSQLTNVIPVSEAATATNRFLLSVIKEAKSTGILRAELERVTGVKIGLNVLAERGPLELLQNLTDVIGRDSPLVNEFITGGKDPSQITNLEAQQIVTSSKLAAALFPNVRALRPFLILAQQGGEQVARIHTDLLESSNKIMESQAEALNQFNRQMGRLKELWNSIKIVLADPIIRESTKVLTDIANALGNIVNAAGFADLSAQNKISKTLDSVVGQLNNWWDSGGRQKIEKFSFTFVAGLIIFLEKGVIDNIDKFIAIGTAMGQGIVAGLIGFVTNPRNFVNPFVIGSGIGLSKGLTLKNAAVAGIATQLVVSQGKNVISSGREGNAGERAIDIGVATAEAALTIGGMALLVKKFAPGVFGALKGGTSIPGVSRLINPNTLAPFLGASAFKGGAARNLIRTPAGGFMNAGKFVARFLSARTVGLVAGGAILSGVGPLRDQGGISGAIKSALLGTPNPESTGQLDIGSIFSGALGGAALGATAGSFLGLAGGPFAPITSTIGAIGGGIFGGLLGGIGAFRGSSNISSGGGVGGEDELARILGVQGQLPKGVLTQIVQIGQNAGITRSVDMMRFIAASVGTIQAESGFDPNIQNMKDPGPLGSVGLFQLSTAKAGQGFGMSLKDLQNPIINTRVGAGAIVNQFTSGIDFVALAQASGHPNASAAGLAGAKRVADNAEKYFALLNNAGTFNSVISGGGSSGLSSVTVNVDGNLILNGVNPNDAEQFSREIAKGVLEAGQ